MISHDMHACAYMIRYFHFCLVAAAQHNNEWRGGKWAAESLTWFSRLWYWYRCTGWQAFAPYHYQSQTVKKLPLEIPPRTVCPRVRDFWEASLSTHMRRQMMLCTIKPTSISLMAAGPYAPLSRHSALTQLWRSCMVRIYTRALDSKTCGICST